MEKFEFESLAPPATTATLRQNTPKCRNVATVVRGRLAKAADHYGCDHDDLLSWYKDDLEMVAEMPSKDLAWAIQDYLSNRNELRRNV